MDELAERQVSYEPKSIGSSAFVWQPAWFLLHLAAVYFVVKFVTTPLSGWAKGWLLPSIQAPTSSGDFEFLFSHIFLFSFGPALFLGIIASRFQHKIAQFVWLVPAGILAYKLLTFTGVATSVLYSTSPSVSAFHQYFGGDFQIPEYRDFHELFAIAASYPDMSRGMAQLTFTAPFYAGLAYSTAAWIGHRTKLVQRLSEKVQRWEPLRFGPKSQ
jgi:hypothetical protein